MQAHGRSRTGPGPAGQSRQRALNKALAEAQKTFRSGDSAGAEAIVRQIMAADRLNLDAMHLQAAILMARNDLPGAAKLLRNVVKLNPAHVTARTDLGDVLRRLKLFTDAEGHLLDVLKQKPRMAGAWLNLGNVYLAMDRFREAEKAYKSALKFGPSMAEAAGNLSFVQLTLAMPDEAEKSARRAIELKPEHAGHHSKLAQALDRKGDEAAAMAAHDRAVELAPASVQFKMSRARALAQFGHMEDAIDAYRGILRADPGHMAAITNLARLKKFSSPLDSDIAIMRRFAAQDGLDDPRKRGIYFALGKALEDCREYDEAFACFRAANDAARKSIRYSQIPARRIFDDIIAADDGTSAGRGGHGEPERAPIFILGMPRSGTSLTEQIISQHPDVHGAGELGVMADCVTRLLAKTGTDTHAGAMARLGQADFDEAAEMYLAGTRPLAPAGKRIADKAPSNFMYIAMIKRMFPEASIIHCRRNPADNALSIFKTNFLTGHIPYAFDLDDVADRYANYRRLMAHWQQVMPGAVLTSDYELLIADQQSQSRKLLDWCGLYWTDEVLDFHKSTRPVHTASIAQVRQPIHSGSVGLAARYGSAAQPLIDALTNAGVS